MYIHFVHTLPHVLPESFYCFVGGGGGFHLCPPVTAEAAHRSNNFKVTEAQLEMLAVDEIMLSRFKFFLVGTEVTSCIINLLIKTACVQCVWGAGGGGGATHSTRSDSPWLLALVAPSISFSLFFFLNAVRAQHHKVSHLLKQLFLSAEENILVSQLRGNSAVHPTKCIQKCFPAEIQPLSICMCFIAWMPLGLHIMEIKKIKNWYVRRVNSGKRCESSAQFSAEAF